MANIKGIELASEIYDLEDTSARNSATAASQTATQAGQTATQASETATQAKQTAEDAKVQADVARDEIGDISSLETSDTSDLVSAINEVNGNVEKKNLLWSNPNPVTPMASPTIDLSFSANAKGLLIRAAVVTDTGFSVLEGKVYFTANKTATVAISQAYIDSTYTDEYIFSRIFTLDKDHKQLYVGNGSMLTITVKTSTMSVSQNNSLLIPQKIYEIL